jgi:hypothetical protein
MRLASHLKRSMSMLSLSDRKGVFNTPIAIGVLRQSNSREPSAVNSDCCQNAIQSIDQCRVLSDRSLIIEDSNDLFADLPRKDCCSLHRQPFINAITGDTPDEVPSGNAARDQLIALIEAALKGKDPTAFSQRSARESPTGYRLVQVAAMCLADRGIATESEATPITEIVVLMGDLLQERARLDALKSEEDSLAKMLGNVIPRDVFDKLEGGRKGSRLRFSRRRSVLFPCNTARLHFCKLGLQIAPNSTMMCFASSTTGLPIINC